MDSQLNKKVYINPNYKPLRGAQVPHTNAHIYINQNFVEPTKSNARIFVNPNFIKSNELLQRTNELCLKPNYSVKENISCSTSRLQVPNTYSDYHNQNTVGLNPSNTKVPACDDNIISKSRYALVRNQSTAKCTARQINNPTLEVSTKNKINTQLTLTKSKYQIIRENSRQHYVQPPDRPIKINKYKMVSLDLTWNKNISETIKNKFPSAKQSPKLRHSISNTVGFKGNITRLNSSALSSKLSWNKVQGSNYDKLKKKSNYQINIESIKGKTKINNIPCPLFSKFGKCLRNIKSKCPYVHDRKHVSVCRKFLKGICHDNDCSLSHELSKKKMPTCYFYLKGLCVKDNCPYLHVKLNEKTKICQDFLKGYCEKGEACLFRHVKVHKSTTTKKLKQNLSKRSFTSKANKSTHKNVSIKEIQNNNEQTVEEDCRYFKDAVQEEFNNCDVIKPTRCKLGTLPSFIKL